MTIYNFGSINVDYVYAVESIVRPGETISAIGLQTFPGGKGANQTVAMCRAGAKVIHAGQVGKDTEWMKGLLANEGADVSNVMVSDDVPGGCAIIQVEKSGQNSIIVLGGTNQCIPETLVEEVLSNASQGEWVTLQNEINLTPLAMKAAKAHGLKVCFNPSPLTDAIATYPLDCVDLLVVNEDEAAALAGLPNGASPEDAAASIFATYCTTMICITLGSKGAMLFQDGGNPIRQDAFKVKAVDTTGAGDTFTGYLIAGIAQGLGLNKVLRRAALAASISVGRNGAIPSIPCADEVATSNGTDGTDGTNGTEAISPSH